MKKWIALGVLSLGAIALRMKTAEPHRAPLAALSPPVQVEAEPKLINPRLVPVEKPAPIATPAIFSLEVLRTEALAVTKIDPNPKETERRLKTIAAGLSEADRKLLAETTLDMTADKNQRRVALYLLMNCPKTSSETYLRVAGLTSTLPRSSPGAHSVEESELLLNQTLAVQALSMLQDRALVEDPALRAQIARVGSETSDRTIKYLVTETVRALASGKKYRLDIL